MGERVKELAAAQETLFIDRLLPALADERISICRWAELDDDDRKYLMGVYDQRIFPVLTPLAVDPAHPFPYVSGLALSLAVMVRDPETGEERFARVKVPTVFPRLVQLPDGKRFVPVEEVIEAQLPTLFSGMEIRNATSFRVTRNADLTLEEEEADDLLAAVEMELRRRRFGGAVRLEVEDTITPKMLNLLVTELDLEPGDVSYHRAPIDLTCLFQLASLDRPDLKDEPWAPVTAGRVVAAEDAERSFFSVIRERALLVHHPYESFASSAEAFLSEAADDPRVQSIKMTLYRPSDDSPVARSLMRAAERGVQVVALVELKARFDEATNVGWAKALERAGVHVVYGLVGLKTHSKCVLVVRNDTDGLRRYVHIGTGNYNSKTARLYEDLGYITCDPAIGADVTQLFNHLTGYSRDEPYRTLLVAPTHLRRQLSELIENEAAYGSDGRITLKMNSLADAKMVELLYTASQAGVQIDLITRGICCLLPGVPGISENIRVRSIVGRYLEHSRVFRFANGKGPGEPVHLIGSADLMPRNLDRRVEVLTPLAHPKHQAWVDQVLRFDLDPDVVRWELDQAGTWHRCGPEGNEPHPQHLLYDWVAARQTGRA